MSSPPRIAATPNGFALHDELNAPAPVRETLAALRQRSGNIPNYVALLAHSPLLWQGYEDLTRLFAESSFSRLERQVIMLSASRENGCSYCMAAHTHSAKRQAIDPQVISALRTGGALADPRLEALRRFSLALLAGKGAVSREELAGFLSAGYSREQALELVLALALKTITNFADRLSELPLDAQYAEDAWEE